MITNAKCNTNNILTDRDIAVAKTFRECAAYIYKKCEEYSDVIVTDDDKINFCMSVAMTLMGNITLDHCPEDIRIIRLNAGDTLKGLSDWFDNVIAIKEAKRKPQ